MASLGESSIGQNSYVTHKDKSNLGMPNKEKVWKPSAPIEERGHPHSSTERSIYEPCSTPYSKDTLRLMKTGTRQRNFDLQRWSDDVPPAPTNGICPFGKLLSVGSVVASFVSFSLILHFLIAGSWGKVSLPFHDRIYEGYALLIQSFASISLKTYVAVVILFRGPIPKSRYIMLISGLVLSVIGDQIWVCVEIMHDHDFQRTFDENMTFENDVATYFSKYDTGGIPSWMDEIQTTHQCCGSKGPKDWLTYFHRSDSVPDSCCVIQKEGCGNGYFRLTEENGKPNVAIFTDGCATSPSRLGYLTYRTLLLLQYSKFAESFITLLLFIILNLCCKNGFVTTNLNQNAPLSQQHLIRDRANRFSQL